MRTNEIIDVLSKFRYIDKYESFHEILPSVLQTPEDQRTIVSGILDGCCNELLELFRGARRPAKTALRKSLVGCMDALSVAAINAENREFGYQLGWYLAGKVNIDLGKGTEKKRWGYWQVVGGEVMVPVRPRVSSKAKTHPSGKSKGPGKHTVTME